jgi:hypothetical protein
MIIILLARELALANFGLVLVRRDAVFVNAIAMAIFNGLGGVGGVGGCVAVRWLGGIRRFRGGRRGGGGSGVVEGCGADGGGCGEPRASQYGVRDLEVRGIGRRVQRVLGCKSRRDESLWWNLDYSPRQSR